MADERGQITPLWVIAIVFIVAVILYFALVAPK